MFIYEIKSTERRMFASHPILFSSHLVSMSVTLTPGHKWVDAAAARRQIHSIPDFRPGGYKNDCFPNISMDMMEVENYTHCRYYTLLNILQNK